MRRAALLVAALAAAQGCAGVIVAALAAHVESSPLLATASQFLTMHAAAGLGLAALCLALPAPSRALPILSFALQAGVTLFSVDLALRGFGHGKLFPYAAPMGGGTTILSWGTLAIWAAARFLKRDAG
jgi:uncharacterized membrane protein YgdD (TMEM256/DUF423 family)